MSAGEQQPLIGIVIASHGSLARALLSSAEMIVGDQEGVTAVCLEPQDNLETFQATLSRAIDQADQGAGVMVLLDVFGGTPGNATLLRMREHEFPAVSGVNLPMLLEVLLSRRALSPESLAELALESGARGIVDITARLRAQMQTPAQNERA